MGNRNAKEMAAGLVLALGLGGCTAKPTKVCAHLDALDALPPAGVECLALMQTIQREQPDQWSDVGSCFLASADNQETKVCYDIISTLAMQRACDDVTQRIPAAFQGSSPACLRALRAIKRKATEPWMAAMSCLHQATTIDAVGACEIEGAVGDLAPVQPLSERAAPVQRPTGEAPTGERTDAPAGAPDAPTP